MPIAMHPFETELRVCQRENQNQPEGLGGRDDEMAGQIRRLVDMVQKAPKMCMLWQQD